MARAKLPSWVETTRYNVGDVLWHGTSARFGITDLKRPSWVSNSHAVASLFARWRAGTGGAPVRVLRYEVVRPFTLPTFYERGFNYGSFGLWLARLLDSDLDFISDLYGRADDVCASGFQGWRYVNHYAHGDDILLCKPDLLLRRVQAGGRRRAGI